MILQLPDDIVIVPCGKLDGICDRGPSAVASIHREVIWYNAKCEVVSEWQGIYKTLDRCSGVLDSWLPVLLLLRCVALPRYRGFHLVELDKVMSYFRLNLSSYSVLVICHGGGAIRDRPLTTGKVQLPKIRSEVSIGDCTEA
jgi:hypothetical protein